MDKRTECRDCDGTGKEWFHVCCGHAVNGECCGSSDTEEDACRRCKGSGTVSADDMQNRTEEYM